jgi:hypothetical protein
MKNQKLHYAVEDNSHKALPLNERAKMNPAALVP